MKKKLIILVLCMLISLSACGKESNEKNGGENSFEAEHVSGDESGQSEATENGQADGTIDAEGNEAESIQDEIARVEKLSREHCDVDTSSMAQQEMNYHSAEWYKLWDDELNSLWSRLSDELDAETKAKVLEEQRAWIKRKEGNATAAGVEALFGSLQPLLESETAAEMTRARVYVLAGYLAEARNESFTISPEIQESLDNAEANLDEVFEKFEGQWIFDESRGACVGIERTENCAYGVEGSNWTVWVTGGDLFSDLDVYGCTEYNILFKIPQGSYYELAFGMEGELLLTYRPSLELSAYDDFDTIVCNPFTGNEGIDYSGMYTDTQGTDSVYSELLLVKQEDGSYEFDMGLYRLTTISGTATANGNVLHFIGYLGEDPFFEGDIVIEGESATVTFTNSTWGLIESGEVFTFPSGKLEMDEISEE